MRELISKGVPRRQWLLAFFLELKDVPAKLSLNGFRDLANLESKHSIFNRCYQVTQRDEGKAAACGTRVFRYLFGEGDKVLTILETFRDFLGLGLSRD